MKKLFLLLLSVVFLSACSSNDDPEVPVVKIDKTVMGYFVANNNLESDLSDNIIGMYKGMQQMTDSCVLLIYWDGKETGRWATPRILKYVADGKGKVNNTSGITASDDILNAAEVVKEYPLQTSTDKQVMMQVLKDMVNLSPSKDYGLIASSHGSGWLNRIDGLNTRSFGQDGSLDNTIQVPDIVDALAATGVKFDFVLFDACLMGCAEVCYDFRNVARYAIVSPVDVPGPGFPYEQMLVHLYGNVEDYKEACKVYIDRYNKETNLGKKFGTITVVDLSEIENMARVVREQLLACQNQITSLNTSKLQYYGEGFFTYYAADMGQILKELNGGSMPDAFQQQLDKTVLYTDYVRNTRYFQIDGDNYCGMGMYVPLSSKTYWNAHFKTLAWYTAAGWEEINWGF